VFRTHVVVDVVKECRKCLRVNSGEVTALVRLENVLGLHAGNTVVLGEIVRDGVPHDLAAGLQNTFGDIDSAAPLDLEDRVSEIRRLKILEWQAANLGKYVTFESFQERGGRAALPSSVRSIRVRRTRRYDS